MSRGKAGCLGCAGILVVIAAIGLIASVSKTGSTSVSSPAPQTSAATPVAVAPYQSPTPEAPEPTTQAPPITEAATTPAATIEAPPETVTYVVTGSAGADIQYGPAGSEAQGHAPMTVTKQLDDVAYYAISAQLSGGGEVSCQIKIGDKVMSQATATGGYNIASCEIVKSFNGGWVDANKS
jgi:hypothetical protein